MTKWVMLSVILVALVAVSAAITPAIWQHITVKKLWCLEADFCGFDRPVLTEHLRGPVLSYHEYDRKPPGDYRWKGRGWYARGGMRAWEIVRSVPPDLWVAYYEEDGRVAAVDENDVLRDRPPWPPGVADQTSPTAPWIAQGITAAEFWENVKGPGEPTLEAFMAEHQGEPK